MDNTRDYFEEKCPYSYRIRKRCEYACCRCYRKHFELLGRIEPIICLLIQSKYKIKDYSSIYKIISEEIKKQESQSPEHPPNEARG